MENLVSVIVPVYNVEKYINECIESIINQTYKNLEIILVDDGSQDNSRNICDEYAKKDNRIKVIHQKNEGVSSARNNAIESSNGEWITFIDADDWVEDNYIQNLITIGKNENAEIINCGYNRVYENSIQKINADGQKICLNKKQYLINTLNPQTGFGFGPTKLMKKETIGNTRFDKSLVVAEDALFNIQISKNLNKAIFLKEPLYNYRNNADSVVKKYDVNYAQKYLQSMKQNKKYIFETYEENDIRQNYYNFVAYHVMLVAVNYCFHPENQNKHKIKLLKEVCKYDEFKEGIAKSNYDNISLTRKITLFTLKHKLYLGTALICKFRQKQNKKG